MTIDHVGVRFFPKLTILRMIGRIAFPIFAYMIAEGCRYTKNRKKYFFTIAFFALLCQAVYFAFISSLYQCILVTFSFSILLIFAFDNYLKKKNAPSAVIAFTTLIMIVLICVLLPRLIDGFKIDYGLPGVIVPLLIYFGQNKWERLIFATAGLILLAIDSGAIQWFSLLSIPLLALYNGNRGKANLKYLFYIYYPLHLAAIYLIGKLL